MRKLQNGFAILNIVQNWCLNLSSSDKNQEKKKKKKNGKFVVFSLRMYDIYEKVFLCIFQIILGSVFNVIFVFILW